MDVPLAKINGSNKWTAYKNITSPLHCKAIQKLSHSTIHHSQTIVKNLRSFIMSAVLTQMLCPSASGTVVYSGWRCSNKECMIKERSKERKDFSKEESKEESISEKVKGFSKEVKEYISKEVKSG
jgi:hypothetical protein